MSKPVAAVAALRATGGRAPSSELLEAIERAITRSENCPQRRVVLGLQALVGGPADARAAIRTVLRQAGAERVEVTRSAPPPESACHAYLARTQLDEPLAGALTLGVSRWTVVEAARFAAALGTGAYGAAGRKVLALMRRPKRPSGELSDPSEYTADPAWGAGVAFAGLNPAYKAGWGGVLQQRFVAGQIAIVRAHDRVVAAAAFFHPSTQPPFDDPGRTRAPEAIEGIFRAVRAEFGALSG